MLLGEFKLSIPIAISLSVQGKVKAKIRIESRKFADAVVMRFFAKQELLLYAAFRILSLLLIHKSSRIILRIRRGGLGCVE